MSISSELALANIGIAITRPLNQATKLTELIQKAGGHVISFPLIEIVPLDDYATFENVIANINDFYWLLFISSNAVQNSMPRLIKQGAPKTLKFAAIGPTTAASLNAFGVKEVTIPIGNRFDSESLLSLPEMHDLQSKKVMVVRGIGGRDVLANTLKNRGATVTFAECYQRTNPQSNCDILTKAYANHQLQSIIVTSSEAMRHLLDLTHDATWLKNVTLCVNHARVAEQPLAMGLNTIVAEAPGDAAMVDLLLNTHI